MISLNASEKGIEKLAKLKFAVNLEELDLSKNMIRDIRELSRLSKLKKLNLSGNQLYDISPLINRGGLAQGATVDLRENQLDLDPGSETMGVIQALMERGVEVLYDSQQPLLLTLSIELRDERVQHSSVSITNIRRPLLL
ncbi:MAG: leucine-rich repeat domain-containing protein [Syntrophomonas sp.]|uniref:leucine-rich repeat domain-containing protein n=1 Tax=Syntrophomonas sp. TaxID=2053627 RepID=UPI00262622D9|nr:leucine-rich repeat domain-containing protein [Syntrophomonas sp.]MDD2510925.1 leucine-rich repeat domain-containing protein [Syntrophomonas sp.]MDD4626889.1 leucine-rich repeat domain-containing protein [Syntrophomonas sp.]